MIIFIYGSDTYRSRQYLKKMIDKFKVERDPSGYNVVVVDAETTKDGGAILQEILTIPFLAERKLIVIQNLLVSKLADLRTELLTRIEAKNLPESTVIVLWEGVEDVKTKEAKAFLARILEEKYKEHFKPLVGRDLVTWIEQEIHTRGGNIVPAALSYIAQHAAADMWYLTHLVDQLLAYANGTDITLAHVMEFVEEKVDDSIFNLVDAIVAKKPERVFKMIREQYRSGEDSGYIFAMLVRQFRILLELRDAIDRGEAVAGETLAKKMKIHPFVVKKTLPMASRYTMAELRRVYEALLDIDTKTKTGAGDQSLLLDIVVGKLVVAT